jgi:adhesin transport system outer membrane protein
MRQPRLTSILLSALPLAARPAWRAAAVRHANGYGVCGAMLLLCMACTTVRADTLVDLIETTLATHPALSADAEQARAAEAAVDAASWAFYPSPSVQTEQVRTDDDNPGFQGDSRVTTLRLQQPLWTAGRLTAGRDKANAEWREALARRDETRDTYALRIIQTYSEWLGAQQRLQAHLRSQSRHEQFLAQVQRRVSEGVAPQNDLVLVKVRLALVMADVGAARQQTDTALARLGALTGEPPTQAGLASAPAAPCDTGLPLSSLQESARQHSPALRQLDAALAKGEAEIDARQSVLMPEVYLRAERQFGDYAVDDADPQNRLYVGVSSSLGAGLSGASNVRSAIARRDALRMERDVEARDLVERVTVDQLTFDHSHARLSALTDSLQNAEAISSAYQRQFLAGRRTWLDVMNAAREQSQTEVLIADLRAQRVLTTWRLAVNAGYVSRLADTCLASGRDIPATMEE